MWRPALYLQSLGEPGRVGVCLGGGRGAGAPHTTHGTEATGGGGRGRCRVNNEYTDTNAWLQGHNREIFGRGDRVRGG